MAITLTSAARRSPRKRSRTMTTRTAPTRSARRRFPSACSTKVACRKRSRSMRTPAGGCGRRHAARPRPPSVTATTFTWGCFDDQEQHPALVVDDRVADRQRGAVGRPRRRSTIGTGTPSRPGNGARARSLGSRTRPSNQVSSRWPGRSRNPEPAAASAAVTAAARSSSVRRPAADAPVWSSPGSHARRRRR